MTLLTSFEQWEISITWPECSHAEIEKGRTLTSCFSSHTENKSPSYNVFTASFWSCLCFPIHGVAKSQTGLSDWTELNWYFPLVIPLFKMGPEWELKCYIVCLSAGDQDVPYEENRWVIKLPSDLRSRGVGCEFSVNQSTINFKRCL